MMKKKLIITALVVGMLAAQTLSVYGAGSTTSSTVITSVATATTTAGTTTTTPAVSATITTAETVLVTLPVETVVQATAQIEAINTGASLKDVVTANVPLDNYSALTTTSAITVDKTEEVASVNVSIYVPNLIGGFTDNVEVLFMDSTTGLWSVLPLTAIDFATRTVSVDLPGSGIYSIVYQTRIIEVGNN